MHRLYSVLLNLKIFSSSVGHSQLVSELSRNETTLYFNSFANNDFQKGITHGVNKTKIKCREQKSPYVQHTAQGDNKQFQSTSILLGIPEAKSLIA